LVSIPARLELWSNIFPSGGCSGSPELVKWLRDWTDRIIKPGYDDYEIIPNFGSTDGWSKVVQLLCEPGDYILVEEHTFPSALTLWAPMNMKGVAIPIDTQGILPDELEHILENWDTSHPGERRPRL
jgi:aromatic amino acid aminotransferase I / 2-aminoadipate transaminase